MLPDLVVLPGHYDGVQDCALHLFVLVWVKLQHGPWKPEGGGSSSPGQGSPGSVLGEVSAQAVEARGSNVM